MRTEFVFKVYDLLEKRLQFEAGWIGHRVAWLTASQSFLFAAYTTAALSPSPWSIPIRLIIIGTALGTLLPTASSIRAAMKVNERLVGVRGLLDRELKRIGDGIGNGNALSQWVELGLDEPSLAGVFRSSTPPRRKTYSKGGRAAKWVPRVLGAAWCLLLLTFCPLVAEIVTERQAVQAPLPAPAPSAPDEAARLRAYWGGIHERLISPVIRWIQTEPNGTSN